jgi:hypothetical protein
MVRIQLGNIVGHQIHVVLDLAIRHHQNIKIYITHSNDLVHGLGDGIPLICGGITNADVGCLGSFKSVPAGDSFDQTVRLG